MTSPSMTKSPHGIFIRHPRVPKRTVGRVRVRVRVKVKVRVRVRVRDRFRVRVRIRIRIRVRVRVGVRVTRRVGVTVIQFRVKFSVSRLKVRVTSS
jgi:hypothetical protein